MVGYGCLWGLARALDWVQKASVAHCGRQRTAFPQPMPGQLMSMFQNQGTGLNIKRTFLRWEADLGPDTIYLSTAVRKPPSDPQEPTKKSPGGGSRFRKRAQWRSGSAQAPEANKAESQSQENEPTAMRKVGPARVLALWAAGQSYGRLGREEEPLTLTRKVELLHSRRSPLTPLKVEGEERQEQGCSPWLLE